MALFGHDGLKFVNIDTTIGLINNFCWSKTPFKLNDKDAIDCSITQLTEKLKPFLLYDLMKHLFVHERWNLH